MESEKRHKLGLDEQPRMQSPGWWCVVFSSREKVKFKMVLPSRANLNWCDYDLVSLQISLKCNLAPAPHSNCPSNPAETTVSLFCTSCILRDILNRKYKTHGKHLATATLLLYSYWQNVIRCSESYGVTGLASCWMLSTELTGSHPHDSETFCWYTTTIIRFIQVLLVGRVSLHQSPDTEISL